MKRVFILICEVLLLHVYLSAESVSKELATQMAIQYMNNSANYNLLSNANSIDKNVDVQTITIDGKMPIYLVQMNDGWILVASEYAANPILASSPNGRFPKIEDLPDGMKWLLSYYVNCMQYAHDSLYDIKNEKWQIQNPSNINANSSISSNASNILNRMSQVHWRQNNNNGGYAFDCSKTYNKYCPLSLHPLDHCSHTLVGCDAVAIAQLMWYHQWPHSALIPIMPNSIQGEKRIAYYDWNNIPTEIFDYSSAETVDAVATFLRDCGYANATQYGDSGSSSNLGKDLDALVKTFHFKSSAKHRKRSLTLNWISKLKAEIDAGRPIIYRGEGNNGGHAFILYGYDENDKFYINWGWGNSDYSNTTFSLDILEPYANSYNEKQSALFYVEPDYPNCNSYHLNSNDIKAVQFEIYNGGAIFAHDNVIGSNKSGVIYSGTGIHITSNFHIEKGSEVHIAIKDIGRNKYANTAPQKSPAFLGDIDDSIKCRNSQVQSFSISPNPVNDILTITTTETLTSISIYNISGQCIAETTQTDINVSSLPAGIYLLRATTDSGVQYQDKFIKQ